jgi:glycosyltransferase involved in cell wall biosynthesis
MPSRGYENAPIGVLEAFACGVPVVASDHGGLPELIDAGVDGDLVPPGDASALATALARFVAEPQRSFEMGRAARSKVEERFSPSGHVDRLERVYEEASMRDPRSSR